MRTTCTCASSGRCPDSVGGLTIRNLLGDTFRLVAVDIALGIPAALALGRLVSGLLYGIEGHDPVVYSLSLGLLATVALAAGYLPAARAARVDPTEALRSE